MALEPGSCSSYSSALNSYVTFCHTHNLPIEPSVDTFSFYIVFTCAFIQPDSVDTYLSGICSCLENDFPHVRSVHKHPTVAKTLAGCKKRGRREVVRKLPLTVEDITRTCAQTVPDSSHDALLFAALLSTGFHALLHLGELVWPDTVSLQSYRKVILRRSFTPLSGSYSVLLPTHKSSRVGTGHSLLVADQTYGLPASGVMQQYVLSRDSLWRYHPELWLLPRGLPLLIPIRLSGQIPTHSWFLARLRLLFPDPGILGHSMRAGGATALALRGVAPYLIQAAGRWSSDEWLKYIRKHPILQQALIHARVEPAPPVS
ncbi:putative retroelement protein [Melanogaster broomeanus]|nr:putative retroelement protein [Melanogaster broomeanus]